MNAGRNAELFGPKMARLGKLEVPVFVFGFYRFSHYVRRT